MSRSFSIAAVALAFIGLCPSSVSGQTLDEIIAKNLAAKGGVEALRSTTTARMSGTVTLPQQGQGAAPRVMRMTVSARRPNLVRRDMTLDGDTRSIGFDGTTAWQTGPGGAVPLEGPQAQAVKEEGEFDSILLTYREQGHTVELLGAETLDGRKVHRVRVTRRGYQQDAAGRFELRADGSVQTYYLDAETGLEHKVTTEAAAGGQRVTSEMMLSDYRTVDGRTVPFRARQFLNGQLAADIVFEKIEYNIPLGDDVFRMPRK